MNGPNWKYLTNQYVEARGMEQFPVRRLNPFLVHVEGFLRPTLMHGFDICVVWNHALYAREPDGLAWSRLP